MTAIRFVIVEGNDVSLFSTKEQAEAALEAIDVRDGVYVGYDADGRLLQISPKGASSEISLTEAEPTHVDDLRDVLRRHLQYLGRAPEADDLGSLLTVCAVSWWGGIVDAQAERIAPHKNRVIPTPMGEVPMRIARLKFMASPPKPRQK